jgi:hypothetical protein
MGGWYRSGRGGLECGSCGRKWGVGGLEEIRDVRVREEIGRRLAGSMRDRHGVGCPWRVLSCPGTSLCYSGGYSTDFQMG